MSAATKMAARQAANQEALKKNAAGVGLTVVEDDPNARMKALQALEETSEPTVEQPKAAKPATTSPMPKASSKPKPKVQEEKATTELIDALTGRSQPGAAADTKIIAALSTEAARALAKAESAVFTHIGKRLIRSAVMTEAARRVAAKPSAYVDMTGKDFGARVPSEVYVKLISATNLAEPKIHYGPRVGSAIEEVVTEVLAHCTHRTHSNARTNAQPHISGGDGVNAAP